MIYGFLVFFFWAQLLQTACPQPLANSWSSGWKERRDKRIGPAAYGDFGEVTTTVWNWKRLKCHGVTVCNFQQTASGKVKSSWHSTRSSCQGLETVGHGCTSRVKSWKQMTQIHTNTLITNLRQPMATPNHPNMSQKPILSLSFSFTILQPCWHHGRTLYLHKIFTCQGLNVPSNRRSTRLPAA